MIHVILAFVQALAIATPSVPPAPKPPPPYSHNVKSRSEILGHRIMDEFQRCGVARTDSNGRYVEAMGTPRFSSQWKLAIVKMRYALTICRGLQRALRDRNDFLLDLIANGERPDSDQAVPDLRGTSSELAATEHILDEETIRFQYLIREGWGDPHCVEQADGYMPAYSICPKGPDQTRRVP